MRPEEIEALTAHEEAAFCLRCVNCKAVCTTWKSGGSIRISCSWWSCPVVFNYPEEKASVMHAFYVGLKKPVESVTVLEWDYYTKPASSHFVKYTSGPELEAEIKRREKWARDELDGLIRRMP